MSMTPYLDQLDYLFNLVAIKKLSLLKGKISWDDVTIESARIERCCGYYYWSTKHKMKYHDFTKHFLSKNYIDIVTTDKYNGLWLDDVRDPEIIISDD